MWHTPCFSLVWWGKWSGNHPQGLKPNLGYKSERKVENKLGILWWSGSLWSLVAYFAFTRSTSSSNLGKWLGPDGIQIYHGGRSDSPSVDVDGDLLCFGENICPICNAAPLPFEERLQKTTFVPVVITEDSLGHS